MSKSSDVVETLLSLDEGDEVWAEATRYEWSRPFEVENVERVEWETIDGSFVSARCRLNPGSPNGSPRELSVVEGGDPPHISSSYGDLEAVDRVGGEDEDEDETLGNKEFIAAVERCDTVAELQEETGYGSEKLLRELGRHNLDDVLLGDVELSDLSEIDFDEADGENEVESESADPLSDVLENDEAGRVREYLFDRAEEADDTVYLKSKDVGDALELSSKQVGQYIGALRTHGDRLDIEDWATNGVRATWALDPLEPDEDDNADEDGCEWLARPAQEIVATADIEHNLGAILDAIKVGENIGQVAYELDKEDPPRGDVASVLWELGLRDKSGRLHDDEILQERIDALREVRP